MEDGGKGGGNTPGHSQRPVTAGGRPPPVGAQKPGEERNSREGMKSNKEEIDADFLAKTYFTLVRCLLEMKRNEEALMYMQKAEEYSARAVFDKWGYVYMHTGEWEKAEEQFIAGCSMKIVKSYLPIYYHNCMRIKGEQNARYS